MRKIIQIDGNAVLCDDGSTWVWHSEVSCNIKGGTKPGWNKLWENIPHDNHVDQDKIKQKAILPEADGSFDGYSAFLKWKDKQSKKTESVSGFGDAVDTFNEYLKCGESNPIIFGNNHK